MSRQIQGLKWARFCKRPRSLPEVRRRKGAKAAGQRFERGFAASAPWALHGPWIEFEDAAGHGHAQPDFLARLNGRPVCFETKLGNADQGFAQLLWLYRPLLKQILGEAPLCIAVVRHLNIKFLLHSRVPFASSLCEALEQAQGEKNGLALLNWREKTPLLTGTLRIEPALASALGPRLGGAAALGLASP